VSLPDFFRRARAALRDEEVQRVGERYEVDLVLQVGAEREAIEIKLSSAPSPGDLAKLEALGTKLRATRRVLLSRTRTVHAEGPRWSLDLKTYLDATRPKRPRKK
jgi:hypothetical protein